MKNILRTYEVASGQVINFTKSGIFYSENVPHLMQVKLSQVLGVNSPLNTGRYLGLPSLIGRKKRSVFHHLRE